MQTIDAEVFTHTLLEKMKYYRIFNPSLVPGLFLASQLLREQLRNEQEQLVADMKPVYYARWEPIEYDRHRCTHCGGTEDYWWADKGTPYCPWCAAKMDGGEFNETN